MVEQDGVYFYGKSANPANIPFFTESSLFIILSNSVKYDINRAVDTSKKVVGAEYSKGFDAQTMAGGITIEGEFVGTDTAWDSEYCTGRPLDFIHYLKCFANGLDPTTGARLTSTDYNCFHILIRQQFSGTMYNYAPGIFNGATKNYYIITKTSFQPISLNGTVKFTITLTEVSDAVNLGRA